MTDTDLFNLDDEDDLDRPAPPALPVSTATPALPEASGIDWESLSSSEFERLSALLLNEEAPDSSDQAGIEAEWEKAEQARKDGFLRQRKAEQTARDLELQRVAEEARNEERLRLAINDKYGLSDAVDFNDLSPSDWRKFEDALATGRTIDTDDPMLREAWRRLTTEEDD